MSVDETPDLDEQSVAFLRLEFETMREMRAALNSLVATETNIYVAIVGATFVALAFIGEVLDLNRDTVRLVSVGALFVVVLLGLATYYRVVESRITVVKYARSMNRVRSYFATRSRDIEQFISPDIHDDMPPFGAVGSTRPVWGGAVGKHRADCHPQQQCRWCNCRGRAVNDRWDWAGVDGGNRGVALRLQHPSPHGLSECSISPGRRSVDGI